MDIKERNTYEQYAVRKDRARLLQRKKLMENRNRQLFILKSMILSVVLIAVISIYGILIVNASDNTQITDEPVKYYTSITIEAGDTLWDIAEQYRPNNCNTISYINEIKTLNHMGTDTLYAGQNIIIYYMSE